MFITTLQKLLKQGELVISVRVKPEIADVELEQLITHILGEAQVLQTMVMGLRK